jgi:hypothetical protein
MGAAHRRCFAGAPASSSPTNSSIAYPIRQFVRGEDGWHEKLVGLDEAEKLTFGLSAAIPAPDSEDESARCAKIAPGLESMIYDIEAAPARCARPRADHRLRLLPSLKARTRCRR